MEERLTRIRDTELFIRLEAMKKPLLSKDLSEYRRLANLYLEFAGSASARPDIELPGLRRFAEEIQALIDEE